MIMKRIWILMLIGILIFNMAAPVLASGTDDDHNPTATGAEEGQTTKTAVSKSEPNTDEKDRELQFTNSLIQSFIGQAKSFGPEWLQRTDIQFNFQEDLKPRFELETIQPITFGQDKQSVFFWQGRESYQSDNGSTTNLGLGYRWLTHDSRSMIGVNGFLDYLHQNDHTRWGIGGEYFTGLLEFRANSYFGLSDPLEIGRTLTTATYERVVSGYDYEFGTSFTYTPWLGIYIQGFHYDYRYSGDENGYRLRSTVQLTPHLLLEAGYIEDGKLGDDSFINVQFNLFGASPSALWGSSKGCDEEDSTKSVNIEGKLLQKVERDHNIRLETYTKELPTGAVNVTVNDLNHQPLGGATVEAYNTGETVHGNANLNNRARREIAFVPGTLMGSGTTDDTGHCSINHLPIGTYIFRVTYLGGVTDSTPIRFNESTTVLSLTLSIRVPAGGAAITVTDGTNPIVGASVSVTVKGVEKIILTNSSGVVSFSNIPAGNYTFTASMAGYTANTADVTISDGGMATSTIPLTRQRGNANITVTDGVNPLSGATVSVTVNGQVQTALTDGSGVAAFNDIPTDTYTFTATKAGYHNNTASVAVSNGATAVDTIALTRQTGNVDITVTDGTNPISGASVSVTVNGTSQTVTTNGSGVAVFTHIPTGAYRFTASKNGYNDNALCVTINNGTTAAETIVLNRQTGGAAITVNDGANLIGGASVSVIVNGVEQTVITDNSGAAVFANIPTGTYTFTATMAGYNDNTVDNITITYNGHATETVSLVRQTGDAFITVDDGSHPLSGAVVSVTVNGKTQTASTDASGVAAFTNIPTGTYTFTATRASYNDNAIRSVSITDQGHATGSISLTRQTGNVSITVNDGTNPLSGATVSVMVNGTTQTTTTDGSGVASFTIIPTGTYVFTATKTDYHENTISNVVITYNGYATGTISLLRQTGNAAITVNDGISPLSDATVSVTVDGSTRTATTNGSGVASFTDVPTGTYTVTATKAGYNDNTVNNIIITNNGNATGTISLVRQTGSVSITVNDGTNPLSGATVSVTVNGKTQAATANGSGVADFTNIPTGSYAFTVTKTDYNNKTIDDVNITYNGNTTLTISLVRQTGNAAITVDDGTNPVGNATVSVTVNGSTQTATTDGSGVASFTDIPTGTYSFTAVKPGYDSNTVSNILITHNGNATGTISLTRQTGNAAITVNDGTNPLSDATVSVTVDGSTRTATTDGSGVASFADVPTGTYAFAAVKSGYNSNTVSNITITHNGNTTGTISLVRQTGNAAITVNDGTNPLSNAIVSVTVDGSTRTATTDSSGVASFTDIPTETYTFTATKTGYNENTVNNIMITLNGNATGTITLVRQTGNAVITVNDGTNPLSNATVSVTVDGSTRTATTDSSGVASFTNVPTGTYAFAAVKSGYNSNTVNNITITYNGNATGTISLIRQTGNVAITVNDGTNPLSNATVRVTVDGSTRTATTDGSGVASFAGIPAGTYTFTAIKTGYNSNTINNITIAYNGNTAGTISLTRQTGSVDVYVWPGNPIKGVTVSFTAEGKSYTGTTGDWGMVSFNNIPTGTYTFTASKLGYKTKSVDVTIPSPGSISIKLEQLYGSADITVTDKSNNPISGATVSVTIHGIESTATTNASGVASFTKLESGTWTFKIVKSGYFDNSVNVTVPGGDTVASTVTMTPAVTVTLHFEKSDASHIFKIGHLEGTQVVYKSNNISDITYDVVLNLPTNGRYRFTYYFAYINDPSYIQNAYDINVTGPGTYTIYY